MEFLGDAFFTEVYRAGWHGTDVAVKKLRSTGARVGRLMEMRVNKLRGLVLWIIYGLSMDIYG